MQHEFWTNRWRQNEIGFHMERHHTFLDRYYHRMAVGSAGVFVPLCGKSPDLLWIRCQGAEVLGVELSEIAVNDFFRENGLDAEVDEVDGFSRQQADGITLLCGDFFDLAADHLAGVKGMYDRGSLVALPQGMRQHYAKHLEAILPADCRILLVSYDYDQDEVDGPPFAVPLPEIEALFGSVFDLELLSERDALPTHNLLRQRGLKKLTEFACLLTRKSCE